MRRREIDQKSYYFLGDIQDTPGEKDIQRLVFKRASYGANPPLVKRETLEERENPKELNEGERSQVHAVFRYYDDEIIVLLETVKPGLTINRIEYYLDEYASRFHEISGTQKKYTVKHSIIAKKDFRQELRQLSRVVIGNIYTDKRLLGSDYYDLSDRTRSVQEEIIVRVKAERGSTIEQFIEDAFDKMTADGSKVHRIRIEGVNQNNTGIILDTKILKKIEHLELETNILTGEIRTEEILSQLVQLVRDIDL